MNIIKKTVFSLFILLLFLLSGCKEETTREKTNITFRITWDEFSSRGEAIYRVVSSYNDSQNNFNVIMIGGNEDSLETEDLLNDVDGPDVFVLPYRLLQSSGNNNLIKQLNDDFLYTEEYFYPSIFNLAKIDEDLFGVPWIGHSMALIYNNDILNKAGVNPQDITDFSKLIDALALVENETNKAGIGLVGANHHDLSWMTTQFIYSFGGSLVNEDNQSISINSLESEEALDYYINQLGQYAQLEWENDNGEDVMEHFKNQEIAFEIQGPWGITDIWKSDNPFDVGAISLSTLGGFSEVGPLMFSISKNADNEKYIGSVDFIKFMISIESLEDIMNGEYIPKYEEYYPFRVPVRKDMIDSDFFTQYPSFKEFIIGFEYPSINTPNSEWVIIHETLYQEQLHNVIIGKITIKEFLEKIETEGN